MQDLPSKYWYLAFESKKLKKKPLGIKLFGKPMVLFRTEDQKVHCLLDRCPHRNIPLSTGFCKGMHIQCKYHGWEFDGEGRCKNIPASCIDNSTKGPKSRNVDSFAVIEQQGFIWVCPEPGFVPENKPYEFSFKDHKDYMTVFYAYDFPAGLHQTAENILDVPHTAFLHKGLFRGKEQNKIKAVISRFEDRAECQYLGEPRPEGVMGKILAPGGGEVGHWDRFLLPAIAQVEYLISEKSHILVDNFLSPIDQFNTRTYSVTSLKLPIAKGLIRTVLKPFAFKVAKQDSEVLKQQSENLKEFGASNFSSSEVDTLGPHILMLLKKASKSGFKLSENGEPELEKTKTIEMWV